MNELSLFAGAGGGILGAKLLGWRTVCAIELDPYARDVLLARQDDGCLPAFPIWDDVRTFNGRPWAGCVDIVTGGFPCQGISVAGRGAGLSDPRSGLWAEQARIIAEVQPPYVLIENSPRLLRLGFHRVIGDLADMGYDARWGVLSAADAIWLGGNPCADHLRNRLWIVGQMANRDDQWELQSKGREPEFRRRAGDCGQICNPDKSGLAEWKIEPAPQERPPTERTNPKIRWWTTEPEMGRMANGVANRVDQIRCLGNGQVPAVVKIAWEMLKQ